MVPIVSALTDPHRLTEKQLKRAIWLCAIGALALVLLGIVLR